MTNSYPAVSNPFASHRIRSGALRFEFPAGDSVEQLRNRFVANRWLGQVVGRHGTGKSTLCHELARYWTDWGRLPVCFDHSDLNRVSIPWRQMPTGPRFQWVIDGFEQLPWQRRWRLVWKARSTETGLLVTSHRSQTWLPVVFRTNPSAELAGRLAWQLVEQWLAELPAEKNPGDCESVRARWLTLAEAYFRKNEGNVREIFFLLYDDFHDQQTGIAG